MRFLLYQIHRHLHQIHRYLYQFYRHLHQIHRRIFHQYFIITSDNYIHIITRKRIRSNRIKLINFILHEISTIS